jgi:uncharacterized protein YggT (Ycf19 family)
MPFFTFSYLVHTVAYILSLLIVIHAVLSWFPKARYRYREATRLLDRVVEPMLSPFRRLIPPSKTGGLDLSPLFALLALQLIERVILGIL